MTLGRTPPVGGQVADLDDEMVFYLQSRGLDRLGARSLLLQGWAREVMANVPQLGDRVDHPLGLSRALISPDLPRPTATSSDRPRPPSASLDHQAAPARSEAPPEQLGG